jgi:hypothetical protein
MAATFVPSSNGHAQNARVKDARRFFAAISHPM